MENKTIDEYALVFECAEESAKFGILLDFLKYAANRFYTQKSCKEEVSKEEILVFKKKFHELETLANKIITL